MAGERAWPAGKGGDDCILDTRLQMENQSVSFQMVSILCMNVNHCHDLNFPWSGSKLAEMGKGLSRDLGCSCPLAPSLRNPWCTPELLSRTNRISTLAIPSYLKCVIGAISCLLHVLALSEPNFLHRPRRPRRPRWLGTHQ
jgi:hypothetical protein